MSEFISDVANELSTMAVKTKKETIGFLKDLKKECTFDVSTNSSFFLFFANIGKWFYIPFLPAFHRPGWLLRYIVGPHTLDLMEMAFSDIWAGITVALTLIPQVCKTC